MLKLGQPLNDKSGNAIHRVRKPQVLTPILPEAPNAPLDAYGYNRATLGDSPAFSVAPRKQPNNTGAYQEQLALPDKRHTTFLADST
jgi:hypothetical protein